MWWWIAHVLGLDDPSGAPYLAWSGFIPNLSVLWAAAVLVRKHNCHVKWCWRIGRHPAGPFVVCTAHHPDVDGAPTETDVAAHVAEVPADG